MGEWGRRADDVPAPGVEGGDDGLHGGGAVRSASGGSGWGGREGTAVGGEGLVKPTVDEGRKRVI